MQKACNQFENNGKAEWKKTGHKSWISTKDLTTCSNNSTDQMEHGGQIKYKIVSKTRTWKMVTETNLKTQEFKQQIQWIDKI